MKIFKLIGIIFIIMMFIIGCKKDNKPTKTTANTTNATNLKERSSYLFGQDTGNRMKMSKMDIDPEVFNKGLKDGLNGKSKFTDEEKNEIYQAFQTDMMAKSKIEAEKNLKDGKDFLEKNKAKKDVITLPSGLQYKVIKDGKGAKPALTDKVKAHYVGKLINGTEFDRSPKTGDPVELPVGGVIKAWQEALTLMSVGSKWELYVPSELGYGEAGSQGAIPPNSTLIFEVELVEILKTPATK